MVPDRRKKAGNLETKNIGENIKFFRVKRQLSQKQLALYAGVSPSYIAYIEKGIRSPSLPTLTRIANGLGLGPELLLQLPSGGPYQYGNRSLLEMIRLLTPEETKFVECVIEACLRYLRANPKGI
ncbi:MAG: helix-turn-helix transcriptional regulator [Bacillota bacterium]